MTKHPARKDPKARRTRREGLRTAGIVALAGAAGIVGTAAGVKYLRTHDIPQVVQLSALVVPPREPVQAVERTPSVRPGPDAADLMERGRTAESRAEHDVAFAAYEAAARRPADEPPPLPDRLEALARAAGAVDRPGIAVDSLRTALFRLEEARDTSTDLAAHHAHRARLLAALAEAALANGDVGLAVRTAAEAGEAADAATSAGAALTSLLPAQARALAVQQQAEGVRGDTAAAIRAGERALDIVKRQSGARSPDAARRMEDLARLYARAGRVEDALALNAEALSIAEEDPNVDRSTLVTGHNNLAEAWRAAQKPDMARPHYRRAIEIAQEGPATAADAAVPMNNLALLELAAGNRLAAEKLFVDALALARDTLGPEHETTARLRENAINFYKRIGRWDMARTLETPETGG
ncbi:tetratricopeptide repeat protein [Futiania mangrovi]|uniref:Tetratricopeptide repeat protein n=1 Tax=Futiania mangrovi TaxID=2959716 RepID=A0A9J6PD62_9PROT|nr:tetratricopeptide repeat protein [Futiania mangrovii]MCP1337317.1 tetratricopeptide repeat protein [Futiania mangrovii]